MIILSTIGGIAIGGSNTQIFAKYGATKRFLLPIFYLMVCFFVLTRRIRKNFVISGYSRLILWGFVVSAWLSLLKSYVLPQQTLDLNFLFQGLLQIGGLVLFIYAGTFVVSFSENTTRPWVILASLISVVTAIFDIGVSPFIMLYIPMSFFIIYCSRKLGKLPKILVSIIGFSCILSSVIRTLGYQSPSIAWVLELSSVTLLFLSLYLKATVRKFVYKSTTIIILILFPFTALFKLLIGISPKGITDVTLLQRSFEASTVNHAIFKDPLSWLFGLGPGGYLNMTWAPDYRTLIGAGRNIQMVDDTHFLTSWILLKLGFFGLLVFLCLVVAALKSTFSVLTNTENVNEMDFLFSANLVGGLAIAITAGTNFFTNPLLGFSIGVMLARAKIMQSSSSS